MTTDREVVECRKGPACGTYPYGPDHHGWDCELSDPMGDVLRVLMDPNPNPLLEQTRRAMLKSYGVDVPPQ